MIDFGTFWDCISNCFFSRAPSHFARALASSARPGPPRALASRALRHARCVRAENLVKYEVFAPGSPEFLVKYVVFGLPQPPNLEKYVFFRSFDDFLKIPTFQIS